MLRSLALGPLRNPIGVFALELLDSRPEGTWLFAAQPFLEDAEMRMPAGGRIDRLSTSRQAAVRQREQRLVALDGELERHLRVSGPSDRQQPRRLAASNPGDRRDALLHH